MPFFRMKMRIYSPFAAFWALVRVFFKSISSNSHRPYPTGNRRDIRCNRLYCGKVHITAKLSVLIAIHSHINDHRTGLDHIGCDKFGSAIRHTQKYRPGGSPQPDSASGNGRSSQYRFHVAITSPSAFPQYCFGQLPLTHSFPLTQIPVEWISSITPAGVQGRKS